MVRSTGIVCFLAAGSALAQTPFPGNDHSYGISASPDLRHVAFVSSASNLVPGDSNGAPDVFVVDRQTGVLRRASVDVNGLQGTAQSAWPAISADGRFVIFDTEAGNIGGQSGLVRKDLQTGVVVVLRSRPGYSPSYPRASADGAVAVSDPGGVIELHEAAGPTTTAVTSGGFFEDAHPVVSDDGRWVVFSSIRSTLVAGDTNGVADVFRWDRNAPRPNTQFERVSIGDAEEQGNGHSPPTVPNSRPTTAARPLAVSADGNLVAFASQATNLTGDTGGARGGLFLRNTAAGTTTKLAACTTGFECGVPFGTPFEALDLSPNGQFLSFVATRAFEAGSPRTVQDAGYYRVDTITLAIVKLGDAGPLRAPFDSRYSSAVAADGQSALIQSTLPLGGDDRATYADVFARAIAGTGHTLLSFAALGTPGDGHSRQPALSDDGLRVAFASDATNLGPSDANRQRDVYLRNLQTGATTLISATPGGAAGNGPSSQPSISGNGAVVAFASEANDLVAGDDDGLDVFVRVLATGATERVSASTNGALGPTGLSRDGRYVAWTSGESLWLLDRQTETRLLASPTVDGQAPNETCNFCETYPLSLSDDGRFVAFGARATNHALGQDNNARDVLVYDRVANAVELISRASGANGASATSDCLAPTISGDGRYVAFWCSSAGGMVQGGAAGSTVFVRDRQTATTIGVGEARSLGNFFGVQPRPLMLRDGSGVVFLSAAPTLVPGDANALPDVFAWDRASGRIRLASGTAAGTFADGSAYVIDSSQFGFPRYFAVAASADGARIATASAATNLANDDRNAADDVFVIEAGTQAIARASGPTVATEDLDRVAPVLSANGRVAALVRTDRDGALGAPSGAAARAKGPASKWSDIAIYDFERREETQVDVSTSGAPADADSFDPSISPSGNQVAFASDATNLGAAPDVDAHTDLFLRDITTGTTVPITADADGSSGESATTEVGDKWSVVFESDASNLPGATSDNGVQDLFIAREGTVENTFTIEPVTVGVGGAPANGPSSDPSIGAGGQVAAFTSTASNLVPNDGNGSSDVFLRNLATGTTTKLSDAIGGGAANGPSGAPSVAETGAGAFVAAFESAASNLVSGDANNDTDIFVRTSAGATVLASRGLGGAPANGKSLNPSISPDGRYVTFTSTASNLVPGDTNNAPDVFVFDRNTGVTTRVSVGQAFQQADDFALKPAIGIAPGGAPVVVFDSLAGNLTPGDTDKAFDVFRTGLSGGIVSSEPVLFRNGFE